MREQCGSTAGYQRHRSRGERPCDACRDARNRRRREIAAARPKPPKVDTTATRFFSKVSGGSFETCWEWVAYRDANGYGRFSFGGRAGSMEMAHRTAWRLLRGEIPDGLQLDHLCRNRACVNPWHLDPVTNEVNSRRSTAGAVNRVRQLAISACPQGHPYDERNTAYKKNGARRCRECDRIRARRYRACV